MKTTVYIRKEDEELWESIENKSQWIADMLNGNETDLERRIKRIAREVFDEIASERGY